jgi:hypothetical protein
MRIAATLLLMLVVATVTAAGERISITSAKTGLRLSFREPAGWSYDGAPRNWPSYQEWGLHRDTSGMIVRVDPISNRLAAAQNHECGGPEGTTPKTIAHVKIAGQTVTLKVTYNPVDESNQAFGSMTVGDSDIYFELNDTDPKN